MLEESCLEKKNTSASASTWEARVWLQFFLPLCRGEINFRDLRKTWAVAASHDKAQQVTLVFYLGKKAKQLSTDEILQTPLSMGHSHRPSFHPSTAPSGHAGTIESSSKFQKHYSTFLPGRTDLFYSITWQDTKLVTTIWFRGDSTVITAQWSKGKIRDFTIREWQNDQSCYFVN